MASCCACTSACPRVRARRLFASSVSDISPSSNRHPDFDKSVDIRGLNQVTFRAQYGDKVLVIGNALGYGLSVKEGVVSVPEIDVTVNGSVRECIMMSATINHGDSGSPILDEKGESET